MANGKSTWFINWVMRKRAKAPKFATSLDSIQLEAVAKTIQDGLMEGMLEDERGNDIHWKLVLSIKQVNINL